MRIILVALLVLLLPAMATAQVPAKGEPIQIHGVACADQPAIEQLLTDYLSGDEAKVTQTFLILQSLHRCDGIELEVTPEGVIDSQTQNGVTIYVIKGMADGHALYWLSNVAV